MEGVIDYVDYRDVPGTNTFGNLFPDEEVFATNEVKLLGCIKDLLRTV